VDLDIDYEAPLPPHRQIAGWLLRRIQAGEWAANQRIPSESDLVQATGTARTTVQRAIRVLRDEGWVYTVSGRGTYVQEGGGATGR
jgi:GntR family transcriptional regulator